MGKCTTDHDKNCPICYSEPSEWTKPKRCRHRYCYQCLTSWVKKGKKNCPLCRKSFTSILRIRRRRVTKPNGTTTEKESCEEIKVDDIKNQGRMVRPMPPANSFTPFQVPGMSPPILIPCFFLNAPWPVYTSFTPQSLPFVQWRYFQGA